ncbi:hypothetical protein F4778DRAFT_221682 [Xylariomycetidae sp. FL2044]|nr:hypothetical protein F4778DRAFT_221682 [Xylariomycetidae sp. FL2044]
MSLARALTTRRGKQSSQDMGSFPHRSNTTSKRGPPASIRSKISAPMELTHATNMLAINAPDLYPRSESSPSRSSKSDDDSSSDGRSTAASSPPTSPDMPSGLGRAASPEPNHLSCYFVAPSQRTAPQASEVPSIPKRSPSHTKKASFDNLASKNARLSNQSGNSVSTKASFTLSRSSSTSTNATSISSASYSRKPPNAPLPSIPVAPSPPAARPSFRRPAELSDAHNPFGQELAQVSELVEELGVQEKLHVVDEEEQLLVAKGLCRFRPEDYISEIQSLISTFFTPESAPLQTMWI